MNDSRAKFEAWYSTSAFNYSANPIGSRDCGLQWKAWQARDAELEVARAKLAEAQAIIALQTEFISGTMDHGGRMVNGNMLAAIANKYHEAAAKTVAAREPPCL